MTGKLLIAPAFPNPTRGRESIFVMSATHRGDMYHIRAAMAVLQRDIYLFDSSDKTADVVDYLRAGAKALKLAYFVAPWNRNTALTKERPGGQAASYGFFDAANNTYREVVDTRDFVIKEYGFISEGDATQRLTRALAAEPGLIETRMKKFMAWIPVDKEREILERFAKANPFASDELPKPSKDSPTMLVLHRASGKYPGGPYPEYDTGEALVQIMRAIRAQKNGAGTATLNAVVAGDVQSTSETPSIGRYWEVLGSAGGVSKRDLEAYFIKWAYEREFFRMAVGFRSGSLDLFTFLGIPTVSIGMVGVMGEDRHQMLATFDLKRVNVQYYQPRHDTTAWVGVRDNKRLIQSPFFGWPPPRDIAVPRAPPLTKDHERLEQNATPRPFTAFDLLTVQVGLDVACSRHLPGWGPTLQHVMPLPATPCVVRAREARLAFPSSLDLSREREVVAWLDGRQRLDAQDIAARGTAATKARMQEPDSVNAEYEYQSQVEWNSAWKFLTTDMDTDFPDIG